jgi:hypothetical protein
MVKIEKGCFYQTPAIRIPEHGHHVDKIIGRGVDVPIFSIDQLDLFAPLSRGRKNFHGCASPWIIVRLRCA